MLEYQNEAHWNELMGWHQYRFTWKKTCCLRRSMNYCRNWNGICSWTDVIQNVFSSYMWLISFAENTRYINWVTRSAKLCENRQLPNESMENLHHFTMIHSSLRDDEHVYELISFRFMESIFWWSSNFLFEQVSFLCIRTYVPPSKIETLWHEPYSCGKISPFSYYTS